MTPEDARKVIDLDALNKLADAFENGALSTSEAMIRTYGAGGKIKAAQDIKALIVELREARAENDRLQTALSLAEDDKLVMAHDLKDALVRLSDLSSSVIQDTRWTRDALVSFGSIQEAESARVFLAKAQGGE